MPNWAKSFNGPTLSVSARCARPRSGRLPALRTSTSRAHPSEQSFARRLGGDARELVDANGDAEEDKVPRTSYTYFDTDWVASISDQKLSDPTSDVTFESRLVNYDYDKRGAQIDWRTKNWNESADGRHIFREFWPNGQLKKRTAAKRTDDADDPVDTRSYEYFYNRNQSLVGMNDVQKDRLTSIARDPVERQLDVNETWSPGKDTRYAYDLAGNVTSRKTDGKIQTNGSYGGTDAKTTTFDYDSLDREISNTVDPATGSNRVTTTNYWPSGQRESRVKPNGTTERWFFNTRGQVAHFDRQRDGQSSFARATDYGYDTNGNRDQDERGSYVFNARDQLVRWAKPSNGKVTEYDLNGDGAMTEKRVLSDPSDTSPETTTFAYRGERLRWAETDDVRALYRYDDLGNVVRIRQRAKVSGVFPTVDDNAPQSSACGEVPTDVANDETYYCYDEFERPALAKGAGVDDPELIGYDGLDRRDTRALAGSPSRDFSYVGTSELLSREVDEDGAKRFYDYDASGDRLGQQVTTSSASRYRAYSKDANGSVLGLEDDQGVIASDATYDYDPYGELENAGQLGTEAGENPFRFEGFYYDSGVKTYDMLARPYRPDVGRFLTQDRYASASEDLLLEADPLTQNRYAFAGGNPIGNVEFDGHCPRPTGNGGPCRGMGNSAAARAQNQRSSKVANKLDTSAAPGWRNYYASDDYSSGRGIQSPPPRSGSGARSSGDGPAMCRACSHILDPIKALPGAAAKEASDTWTGITQFPGTVGSQMTCRIPRNPRGDHPACPSKEENLEALETASLAAGVYGGLERAGAVIAERQVLRSGADAGIEISAQEAAKAETRLLGPGTSFGSKIEGQLATRGWTERLVQSTIDDPARTIATRDTRFLPGGGRMDDPATGYISRRGGYVIRNDRTGDIVQVSKRTDPNWRAPWDR